MREIEQLSEIELRMLTVLYLLTNETVRVNGRALSFWLGGRWTKARRDGMLRLEQGGWVRCHKVRFFALSKKWSWHYNLTSEARMYLRDMVARSLHRNTDSDPTSFLEDDDTFGYSEDDNESVFSAFSQSHFDAWEDEGDGDDD